MCKAQDDYIIIATMHVEFDHQDTLWLCATPMCKM